MVWYIAFKMRVNKISRVYLKLFKRHYNIQNIIISWSNHHNLLALTRLPVTSFRLTSLFIKISYRDFSSSSYKRTVRPLNT